MPLPPIQIYSKLAACVYWTHSLSLSVTPPPLFLIVGHDNAAFYFIIYHVVFGIFLFLKNINLRLVVKELWWSSTGQDQHTVPPTSHMCISALLWFNLVRVEIRELRPEVVAESNEVLVHYRSRTNV